MSAKTTRRISRQQAIHILLADVPTLSNDLLAELLDWLADSGQSKTISKLGAHLLLFDNFIVSDMGAL